MLRPGAGFVSHLQNLLRVACFLWSVFLGPFPRSGAPPEKKMPPGVRLKPTRPGRPFKGQRCSPRKANESFLLAGVCQVSGADGRLPIRPRCGRVCGQFRSFRTCIAYHAERRPLLQSGIFSCLMAPAGPWELAFFFWRWDLFFARQREKNFLVFFWCFLVFLLFFGGNLGFFGVFFCFSRAA